MRPERDGGVHLGIAEARSLLSRIGWLSNCPSNIRETLLGQCRLLPYDVDEHVFQFNDAPNGIYGLVMGQAALSVAFEEHGPYLGHLLRPGNWVGVAAPLSRMPRRISLRATRPSQFLLFPTGAMEKMAEVHPLVWKSFAQLATMNAQLATAVAGDLMIRDAKVRVLAVLCRLAGLIHNHDGSPPLCEVDVAQDQLAALANLSRNAVGGIIRPLEKKGLLRLRYGGICIVDPKAIVDMIVVGERN